MLNIEENKSLYEFNHFKINSIARFFCSVESVDQLLEIFKDPKYKEFKKYILGDGANVVLNDFLDGVILKINIKGMSIVEEDDDFVYVRVGAGELWHDFVEWCVDRGYYGVENMALIPSSIGGAAFQNIAAYGGQISDVITSVDFVDLREMKRRTLSKKECKFEYRSSIFKNDKSFGEGIVITHVDFRLAKHGKLNFDYWSKKHGVITDEIKKFGVEPYGVRDVFQAVINLREKKFDLPKGYGCAGSFFKNPVVSLEKLKKINKILDANLQFYPVKDLNYNYKLDEEVGEKKVKIALGEVFDISGWLGRWIGNTGVHPRHGITLITNGQAKSSEVLHLAESMEKYVGDNLGIEIEREVRYVE